MLDIVLRDVLIVYLGLVKLDQVKRNLVDVITEQHVLYYVDYGIHRYELVGADVIIRVILEVDMLMLRMKVVGVYISYIGHGDFYYIIYDFLYELDSV